jgi:hypothetical protein
MILDQVGIAMMMVEGPMEPGNFDEAYNHSDLDSKAKWRSTIDKEFKEMNLRGFRKNISKSEMPDGSQCAKGKWVIKIKRNSLF